MVENDKKQNEEEKESVIWFITKQILGFILTMLMAPMLIFGGCLLESLNFWSGGSHLTLDWLVISILILIGFWFWFRTTKNYGVRLALIILSLLIISTFFG